MELNKPLVIIPVYIHRDDHVSLLIRCLESLRDKERTSADVDIILVDDCSPFEKKSELLASISEKYDCMLHENKVNSGFSRTVNVGLMKAHMENRHAILCNMDIEFSVPGFECPNWLEIALEDEGDVVGARLLYPNGLVQHSGIFYSVLHRYLDHLGRFAPPTMKEVNIRREVPVTGALQIIKHHVLDTVGYYDEKFKMAYEDCDYNMRVMLPPEHGGAGMKVVYNPEIVAMHHESIIRGGQKKFSDWHDEGWVYFQYKYANVPLQFMIPPIDAKERPLV